MATWVSVVKAAKFPEVERVYKRAGRGQGTGQGIPSFTNSGVLLSAPKGFLRTVAIFFQGETPSAPKPTLPAWIRKSPLSNSNDWQNAQVDVTAMPGVRPLRKDGKWTGYVA